MGIRGTKRAEVFNPSIPIPADSGVRFNMRVRPVTTKQTVFTIYVIGMHEHFVWTKTGSVCGVSEESFIAQMLIRRLNGGLKAGTHQPDWRQ